MKKRISLLISLLFILVAGATGFYQQAMVASVGGASESQNKNGLAQRIERVETGLLPAVVIEGSPPGKMKLADRMAFHKVPGLSIAVINNNSIEWARGYGVRQAGTNDPVTTETLFQAASISKPVAAMAALALVSRGLLALDEDVNKKLTSWKVPESEHTKEKKVTLRGLLTHSAGLTVHGFRGYASDEAAPTLQQVLDGAKPANSAAIRVNILPGSKWRYSGGGFSVMQQLLVDVTNKPFPEIMRETVLGKLGMKHSTYEQPLPKALYSSAATGHRAGGEMVKGQWHTYPEMAAAGLWTTPTDLALFAIELQRAKAGKSNKVLSSEVATQMLTRQVDDWGLGLAVEGTGAAARFSHGGSNEGFRCFMIVYSETGKGAVIMTNSDRGDRLAQEILRSLAVEYGWPDYAPKQRAVVKVDPKIYESYAGVYEAQPGLNITVVAENGRLFLQAAPLGPERIELYPETEDRYFMTVDNVIITFVKNESGAVTEMIAQPPGRPLKAKKIK